MLWCVSGHPQSALDPQSLVAAGDHDQPVGLTLGQLLWESELPIYPS
jgi:hypothetical protein